MSALSFRAFAASPSAVPRASTLHLTNATDEHGATRTLYRALLDRAEATGRRMTLVVPGRSDAEQRWGRTTTIQHVQVRSGAALILQNRLMPARRARLWQILEQVRPDVLEICDKYSLCYFAGLVRRRRRRGLAGPALVGLTCDRLDEDLAAHVGGGRIVRATARQFLGRAYIGLFDLHLANSTYTADELKSAMRLPHQRPVHICRMGIDSRLAPDPVRRAQLRTRLQADCGMPGAALVAYAGTIDADASVNLLANAIAAANAQGRPSHLLVAGEGRMPQHLENACRHLLQGRVTFLGPMLNREDVEYIVAASDVFVHLTPRESFGVGPLDAMALGTAVVLVPNGSVRAYAHHENAWFADRDPDSIGAALRECLEHDVERERRVRNGRRTAERHAWPRVADEMFAIYDKAAAALHSTASSPAPRIDGFERHPSYQ